MKCLSIVTASIALLFSGITFAASMQSLSQNALNDQLKNKTITTIPLVTLNGALINNTFTGFFAADGKLQGQLNNAPSNGPKADTGSWMVKANGALCATWNHWNDNKPLCVLVYKVNNGMVFINEDNQKLETIILDDNIRSGNQIS